MWFMENKERKIKTKRAAQAREQRLEYVVAVVGSPAG
jgi:hypothetical protein